jgi:hypothetical protein
LSAYISRQIKNMLRLKNNAGIKWERTTDYVEEKSQTKHGERWKVRYAVLVSFLRAIPSSAQRYFEIAVIASAA